MDKFKQIPKTVKSGVAETGSGWLPCKSLALSFPGKDSQGGSAEISFQRKLRNGRRNPSLKFHYTVVIPNAMNSRSPSTKRQKFVMFQQIYYIMLYNLRYHFIQVTFKRVKNGCTCHSY
jgi:hypothetical protein